MASTPTRQSIEHPDERSRCESYKVGFRTRAEALDAAEKMMDLGRVNPGCHQTPYECPDCGQWHVGNKVIVRVRLDQRLAGWDD